MIVRWEDGRRTALVALGETGVAAAGPGSTCDLAVRWPVGPSWHAARVAVAGGPRWCGALGFRSLAAVAVHLPAPVLCRILLPDGPRWQTTPGSIELILEGSTIRSRRAEAGGVPDLILEAPWRLVLEWLGDDHALFGDLVGEQLSIDGDLTVLSAIEGARWLGRLAGHHRPDLFLAWNELWEDPDVRSGVERLLAADSSWVPDRGPLRR